ncbi:hypothetical protein SEHO0A_02461 [Salmonella enterica subsp. houtenae str. ATCC BAA-1581]|nr:hypothetical protein SEHO0A_02461 [Salmonella enterica subsp. houtenae str. ATCC BAA-1581]ENZ86181.1 hypothetical protein D088_950110 [Salmonella enterica subsp. houtenae serovar 16:z4,z32:-- str. RKS3027]
MISVKMADKNALKLTGMKRGVKHLMLCPFAAIKKPHSRLRWMLQV